MEAKLNKSDRVYWAAYKEILAHEIKAKSALI